MSELIKKAPEFDEAVEEQKAFRITDDATADWAMRKVRESRMDTDKWKVFYDAQKKAIKAGNDNTESFFTEKLREYFGTVPHKVTKGGQHKYALPTGEMIFKHQEPEYEITDEAAMIDWLKANGMEAFVKTKETVDWSALKKLSDTAGDAVCIKETGEAIPGIKATLRDDVFTLSIK